MRRRAYPAWAPAGGVAEAAEAVLDAIRAGTLYQSAHGQRALHPRVERVQRMIEEAALAVARGSVATHYLARVRRAYERVINDATRLVALQNPEVTFESVKAHIERQLSEAMQRQYPPSVYGKLPVYSIDIEAEDAPVGDYPDIDAVIAAGILGKITVTPV